MLRSLPPLNSVKAFECAGRHGSLTIAAAELGVTHGAISRQIKILEEWLGVRLFVKTGRGLTLTPDGQQYRREATKLLDEFAAASERLTARNKHKILRVNAPQTFTMRWLIPRLPKFTSQHPEIEFRFSASIEPVDKITDHFDISIRRGPMGSNSTPFLAEECVPVASPKLLEALPVRGLTDLSRHTLLHAVSVASLWQRWLEMAGYATLNSKAQMHFESMYHSLQAAIDGAGIAMGPSALVASDIIAGRLVSIFPERPLPLDSFHMFIRPGPTRNVRLLQRWLLKEGRPPAH